MLVTLARAPLTNIGSNVITGVALGLRAEVHLPLEFSLAQEVRGGKTVIMINLHVHDYFFLAGAGMHAPHSTPSGRHHSPGMSLTPFVSRG